MARRNGKKIATWLIKDSEGALIKISVRMLNDSKSPSGVRFEATGMDGAINENDANLSLLERRVRSLVAKAAANVWEEVLRVRIGSHQFQDCTITLDWDDYEIARTPKGLLWRGNHGRAYSEADGDKLLSSDDEYATFLVPDTAGNRDRLKAMEKELELINKQLVSLVKALVADDSESVTGFLSACFADLLREAAQLPANAAGRKGGEKAVRRKP